MRRPSSQRRSRAGWVGLAEAAVVMLALVTAQRASRRRVQPADIDVQPLGWAPEPAPAAEFVQVQETVAPQAALGAWVAGVAGVAAAVFFVGSLAVVFDIHRRARPHVTTVQPVARTSQGPDDPLANLRVRAELIDPPPAAPAMDTPAPPPPLPPATDPPTSTSAPAAPPVSTPAPASPPVAAPPDHPARVEAQALAPHRLPAGKGMWLHNFDNSEAGDAAAIVAKAKTVGLSHIYVRLGDSRSGFYAQQYLDRLLPLAHAAGLQVVGWDFPLLGNADQDADRGFAEISYRTPGGDTLDAFSPDIETPAEGTNLSVATMLAYGTRLRTLAGPDYPLIATVPRPGGAKGYPYAEAARSFDAFAPMVYWMNRDPVADVTGAIDALSVLGRPVMPVGQAYDGAVDGGPAGAPSKDALARFASAASGRGATGFSFWSWETATADHWQAISEARQPG